MCYLTYLYIYLATYLTYCFESTLVPRSALSYIDRSYRERQASHRPLDPSDLPLFNVFMHHPLGYTNPLGFYPYKFWSELLYGVFSHSFLFMYGRHSRSRYSTSSGRRYRRVTRRIRRPIRTTSSARRSLGLKRHNSPSVNMMANYLYRVVGNIQEDVVALPAGGLVTTNSVPIVDLLKTFWQSANFNSTVKDRFASIRIKGFAITRTILGAYVTGVTITPPTVVVLNCAYLIDKKISYGTMSTLSTPELLA